MVVPGNDITASRRWRAALRIGDRIGRGAVRGIGRTIRFRFALDIGIGIGRILVADFIKSLGRHQAACRPTVRDVGARRRRRFRRWLPRLHDRPSIPAPLTGRNMLAWWRFRS